MGDGWYHCPSQHCLCRSAVIDSWRSAIYMIFYFVMVRKLTTFAVRFRIFFHQRADGIKKQKESIVWEGK